MGSEKSQQEIDRNFYACESLIDYALRQDSRNLTEKVLKELEKTISRLKKKIICNSQLSKEIKASGKIIETKERLRRYYLIFRALYNLSKQDSKFCKAFREEIVNNLSVNLINGFNVKQSYEFEYIDLKIEDMEFLYVKGYENERILKALIDFDEVVITREKIMVFFEHPWIHPWIQVKIKYENKEGFSKGDLFKIIYEGYKQIYDDYTLKINGEDLGIGGYLFSDLILKRIIYIPSEDKVIINIA